MSNKLSRISDLVIIDDPHREVLSKSLQAEIKAWHHFTMKSPGLDVAVTQYKTAARMFPKETRIKRKRHLTKAERKLKNQKRSKAAKNMDRFKARKAKLDEGRFFYRYQNQQTTEKNWIMTQAIGIINSPMIKIAKILNGDLWIRNNHGAVAEDQTEWSKAKNAKPTRLNQEILQIGHYLENREIEVEWAEELLDLLYAHLGRALR